MRHGSGVRDEPSAPAAAMLIAVGWGLMSVVVGYLGRHREFGFWGFFLASIIFSPVLVLLVLLLTRPNPARG